MKTLTISTLFFNLTYTLHAKTSNKNEFSLVAQTCFTNIASLNENKHVNRASELYVMTCEEDLINKKSSCLILIDGKKQPTLMNFSFLIEGGKKYYLEKNPNDKWIIDTKMNRFYSISHTSLADLNAFITKSCSGIVMGKN